MFVMVLIYFGSSNMLRTYEAKNSGWRFCRCNRITLTNRNFLIYPICAHRVLRYHLMWVPWFLHWVFFFRWRYILAFSVYRMRFRHFRWPEFLGAFILGVDRISGNRTIRSKYHHPSGSTVIPRVLELRLYVIMFVSNIYILTERLSVRLIFIFFLFFFISEAPYKLVCITITPSRSHEWKHFFYFCL